MTDISKLCKTIESVVHLASKENTGNSLQLHTRQCERLAKKAYGTLHVLKECQNVQNQDGPRISHVDWTPAAIDALHRVLKDVEILIRDCCCDAGQWLKVVIRRGSLKETFEELLYDIEWHTSVLCSGLVSKSDTSDALEKSACEGKLGITEHFLLLAAAKQDRESLRELLKFSHVCDAETCKAETGDEQSCLAKKLLEKLDAEEQEFVDKSMSPLVLWVRAQHLRSGGTRGIVKGASAEVKEIKWLGQKYAMKTFLHGTSYQSIFKQEIEAMAGLEHPHIVSVVCCSDNKVNLGIVMELMYKSLYGLLQDYQEGNYARGAPSPFSIIQSVDLMQQIAEGVRFLHGKNLAHRDIKSDNILVQFADPPSITDIFDDDADHSNKPLIAKIADFGISKIKHESTLMAHQTLNTGTRQWMAPEVIKLSSTELIDPAARFHPMKIDVYSFGIVCFEILTGDVPYANMAKEIGSLTEVYHRVKNHGLRPTLPERTPTRLKVMIERCWDANPRRRPSFPDICTELRYIKGLLLRGNASALNQTTVAIGPVFDLEPGIKVQGPWGGTGGGQFFDGQVTSIKQIKLVFDSHCIRYIEMEYNINGTSFVVGHGKSKHGDEFKTAEIKIDDPSEYVVQIEGWYGESAMFVGPNRVTGVTSLTIRTSNEVQHGPYGAERGTKFTSDRGRIVGFFGKCGLLLDRIGCFTTPSED